MNVDLDTYSTYSSDKKLFAELGLKQFKEILNWTKIEVGTIEKDDYIIKLSVEGCPAQFWTAEIVWKDTEEIRIISTGSGALETYWKSIEMIAERMLEIQ